MDGWLGDTWMAERIVGCKINGCIDRWMDVRMEMDR